MSRVNPAGSSRNGRIADGIDPNARAASARRKRDERATEIIAREAARFIAQEAGSESIITVVRAESAKSGERADVFVSVFPEEKARAALAFLARQREAFSDHLKRRARLKLPRVDFLLDDRAQTNAPSPLGESSGN